MFEWSEFLTCLNPQIETVDVGRGYVKISLAEKKGEWFGAYSLTLPTWGMGWAVSSNHSRRHGLVATDAETCRRLTINAAIERLERARMGTLTSADNLVAGQLMDRLDEILHAQGELFA